MATKNITIELSDANAWALDNVAAVLNKSKNEVLSLCLKGSTNPKTPKTSKK